MKYSVGGGRCAQASDARATCNNKEGACTGKDTRTEEQRKSVLSGGGNSVNKLKKEKRRGNRKIIKYVRSS